MNKFYFVVVVCFAVTLVWLGVVLRGGSELRSDSDSVMCDARTGYSKNELERSGWKLMELEPPRKMPTAVQSNALVSAFAALEEAYARGNVELMMQRMSLVPDCVADIPPELFASVTGPIRAHVDQAFAPGGFIEEFPDVKTLSQSVRANIECARFIGQLMVRRGGFGKYLGRIDRRVLKRLIRCRDKFRADGNTDFVQCVERFVVDWINQIEWEDGFTRCYMWRQVSLQYSHVA